MPNEEAPALASLTELAGRPLTEEGTSDGWAEPEKDGAPEALALSIGDVEAEAEASPEEEAPVVPDAGTDAALPDCTLTEDEMPEDSSEPERVDATGALRLSLRPADAELLTSAPMLLLVAVTGGTEDWPGNAEPEAPMEPWVAEPTLDVTPEDEIRIILSSTSISKVTPKDVSTMI